MGDDGAVGGRRDVPGMLKRFGTVDKWVALGNSVDIDWSKFKVMELVETLMNSKNYNILEVWALVDLLPEEPPCTVAYHVGAYSLSGLLLEDNNCYGGSTMAGTRHAFIFRFSLRLGNNQRVIENLCVCGEVGNSTSCLRLPCSNQDK
jgi:hypothetical protein